MTHRDDWNAIAELDPRWAVLSVPEGKYGRWDDGPFFATGEEEVAALLASAAELGLPERRESALDFGCGLGRLTRALAARFDRVVGVDISEAMVREARRLNAAVPAAEFVLNERDDLGAFADASFDLVCTTYVLQHHPSAAGAERSITELIRVLRPGGLLAFQLPAALDPVVRAQPRARLYRLLRQVGFSPRTLYWRLGLHPMRMLAIPPPQVRAVVERAGGRVLRVGEEHDANARMTSARYLVTR